ncbi:hypothetical protein GALL_510240 [mine drainage metagenome]|uniref:Uncharacterized protein n=1 Tax=mine drainage metagenome TaxID=410659 RepID=A0A1J5PV05_9ZZZZ
MARQRLFGPSVQVLDVRLEHCDLGGDLIDQAQGLLAEPVVRASAQEHLARHPVVFPAQQSSNVGRKDVAINPSHHARVDVFQRVDVARDKRGRLNGLNGECIRIHARMLRGKSHESVANAQHACLRFIHRGPTCAGNIAQTGLRADVSIHNRCEHQRALHQPTASAERRNPVERKLPVSASSPSQQILCDIQFGRSGTFATRALPCSRTSANVILREGIRDGPLVRPPTMVSEAPVLWRLAQRKLRATAHKRLVENHGRIASVRRVACAVMLSPRVPTGRIGAGGNLRVLVGVLFSTSEIAR